MTSEKNTDFEFSTYENPMMTSLLSFLTECTVLVWFSYPGLNSIRSVTIIELFKANVKVYQSKAHRLVCKLSGMVKAKYKD
jgi:hypothetical protein